jgi:cyclophilin family peptidyl-prolyl cis-trans isomerase
MDGKTVVFGRVVEGFRVFKLIEKLDLVNEKPAQPVRVVSAGIHELRKPKLPSKK